jgi:RimJ/RimL family protein N-acetyltransferase
MQPIIKDSVLYGADDLVAEWVQRRLGGSKAHAPFVALGVLNDAEDELIGGCVFFNAEERDIQFAVAMDTACAKKVRAVARCYGYVFNQLGIERITAMIEIKNKASVKLAEGVGFVREGVKRRSAPDGGHVGVYGLLKKDFKLARYL